MSASLETFFNNILVTNKPKNMYMDFAENFVKHINELGLVLSIDGQEFSVHNFDYTVKYCDRIAIIYVKKLIVYMSFLSDTVSIDFDLYKNFLHEVIVDKQKFDLLVEYIMMYTVT